MHPNRLILIAVPVFAACAARAPAPSSSATQEQEDTCGGAKITHDLGSYIEDADATKAHLKTSAAMSPEEIDAKVAKWPAARVRITASGVTIDDRRCCIALVRADTNDNVAFEATCGPEREYRFTFITRPDGKLLFVADSDPGQPRTPGSPGLQAIRYEELVLAKSPP